MRLPISWWHSRHLEFSTLSPSVWHFVQLDNPSSSACALVSAPGDSCANAVSHDMKQSDKKRRDAYGFRFMTLFSEESVVADVLTFTFKSTPKSARLPPNPLKVEPPPA
jgi:hypothetical protein